MTDNEKRVSILNEVEAIAGDFQDIFFRIKTKNTHQARTAMMLATSILESHLGIVLLLRSFSQAKSFLLVREMQESLATLICLSDDLNHFNVIVADNAKQSVQMIEGILSQSLITEPQATLWKLQLEQHRSILKEKSDAGFPPMSFKMRFDKAGMLPEYEFLYRLYSSYAHNNLTSSLSSYGHADDILFGNDLEFGLFKVIASSSLRTFILSLTHLSQFTDIDVKRLDAAIAAVKPVYVMWDFTPLP